jgi:hypothetical protein
LFQVDAAEYSSGRALIAELGVVGEKGIYYLGIPVDFRFLVGLFTYADRRFLGAGKDFLRAISASSKNLLLRGGSPGPNSQPTFGGGHFRLCDGAIHRPFFEEERSLFLAFLKPWDDMAQN